VDVDLRVQRRPVQGCADEKAPSGLDADGCTCIDGDLGTNGENTRHIDGAKRYLDKLGLGDGKASAKSIGNETDRDVGSHASTQVDLGLLDAEPAPFERAGECQVALSATTDALHGKLVAVEQFEARSKAAVAERVGRVFVPVKVFRL
jgi:hypothetical protein